MKIISKSLSYNLCDDNDEQIDKQRPLHPDDIPFQYREAPCKHLLHQRQWVGLYVACWPNGYGELPFTSARCTIFNDTQALLG